MDRTNVQLIELLLENPRSSISELARNVSLSAPSVRERLTRLEDAKVIGYRLELDAASFGWPLMAIVRVRPLPGKVQKIAELAMAFPQVIECHRITGEDCYIIKLVLKSLDSLDVILDRFLAFGQTTTSLVQSTPVPLRAPPFAVDRRR